MSTNCLSTYTVEISYTIIMSVNWTDKKVFHLCDCWSKEEMQEQLEGSRRNKQVYEKLALSQSLAG